MSNQGANMLKIVLRNETHTVEITSSKMEVFADRVEGWHPEWEHFEIHVNNGNFLAGHLPCCAGWEDGTAVFDFCTAYSA